MLEAQRAILGDAVVDAAIAPIREQLATQEQGEGQAGVVLPAGRGRHYHTIQRPWDDDLELRGGS